MVILCYTKQVVVTVSKHLEQYLPEGIHTDSGCNDISDNPSFHQKHPGVPVGSDGSDKSVYPVTEKYTLPVAHPTDRIAYLPHFLCAQKCTI
jgi:hypothetical protein